MILLFLSFTFLLAAYLPRISILYFISSSRALGISGDNFFILSALSNYIIAALIATIFFKVTHIKDRLPRQIPGAFFMLAGIILTVLFFTIIFQPITDSTSHIIRGMHRYFPLISWIANMFLIVGVIKELLSAKPSTSNP